MTKGNQPFFMFNCELCGTPYQMGPGIYEGKTIARYQLSVCGTCYAANWDGWAPHLEPAFIEHLQKKGIPLPERNAGGWYPRD